MDVEQSFRAVGAFGRYQIFCYTLLASMHIYLGLQMFLMEFIALAPEKLVNGQKIPTDKATTIVDQWKLQDSMWIVGLIKSIYFLGVLLGNLFIGQLSDKFGRKAVLYKVYILLICFSFFTLFANNYQTLAVIRFFVGVFVGGTVLVSFVLIQELLGSSVWTISGNILPALFALGLALLAGLASVFKNWRDLCIVTSLPGIILCIGSFIVPESPRWLYSQGSIAEAEQIMRYMAQKNGVPFKECNNIILKPKASSGKTKSQSYTIKDLFITKRMVVRTLVMGYLWFVCSFSYYGLTMSSGHLSSSVYTSFALSGLVELPSYVIAAILINRHWAGRKRTLVGMLLLGGIFCLCIMFMPPTTSGSFSVRMGFALGGKLAMSAAFSIVYIYATELFPTVVRNVGMGTSSVCARVGGMLAPLVISLAQFGTSLPYIVFGVVAVVAGFMTLLLPETLNEPIPDNLQDVEVNVSKAGRYQHNDVPEDKIQLLQHDEETV
ncbi:solute carrier family 22 member 15-like [Ciona intestinalis]